MKKTIDQIKKNREITPALKEKSKTFNTIKRKIMKCLKTGPKTILEISVETGIKTDVIMYYLMSLRKFGKIESGDPDDLDEYFYYSLKAKK